MSRQTTRNAPTGLWAAVMLAVVLALGSDPSSTISLASHARVPVPNWSSPNGDLHNGRVAPSTITSANVSQLRIVWRLPLKGDGLTGYDVANPVIDHGIVYLQDGASNVMAVRFTTGKVLWTHRYNSRDYGPNGVTIANGRIYGITANGIFALDATTGRQVWYTTHLASGRVNFDMPPQVTDGRVFVASALTVGGGILYALNARTGAIDWRFQTVADKTGQHLKAPSGGAWDAVMIGPDHSIYAGIGNPYLSQQQAQSTRSRELYTDSLVKLSQATGKVEWYYQAFPDDFHDWDLQISPVYTTVSGHHVVLAAGKGGYVFAFAPASGKLLWKTAVGIHNGHDRDDELALNGKLRVRLPYTVYPGDDGGVETNMAAAQGAVYVPVVNLPSRYISATAPTPNTNFANLAKTGGEMDALALATGKHLWTTKLPHLPLGGATIANGLVFTTTFTGEVLALSRRNGSIVWKAHLPAGSNAPLAIAGSTLLAGAGLRLAKTQHPMVVAYRLGAK